MYKFRGIFVISVCLKTRGIPLMTTIAHYENNKDTRATQLIKDTIKTMICMYKMKNPSLFTDDDVFVKIHKFTDFKPDTIAIRSLKNDISRGIRSELKLNKVYDSDFIFDYIDSSVETKIKNITLDSIFKVCHEFSEFWLEDWVSYDRLFGTKCIETIHIRNISK